MRSTTSWSTRPDALTEADLVAAVERGRGRDCWVARSEARVLVDQPTRALGLAGRLVRDPDALGELLRTLLGADAVTWRPVTGPPAGQPERHRFDPDTMWLADPAGGSFEVVRAAPDFTPAEYARAQALVDLAAAVAERGVDRVTLLLTDGAEVEVRPATGDDLPAVADMHRRCSAASRQQRYPTGAAPTGEQLSRSLVPATGVSLVATVPQPDADQPRLIAVGTPDRRGRPGGGGVAGARTPGSTGGSAPRCWAGWWRTPGGAGHAAVLVHTGSDNLAMLHTLARFAPATGLDRDGPLVTATVPLATGGPPTPAASSPAAAGA